jgi:hypothetical protein
MGSQYRCNRLDDTPSGHGTNMPEITTMMTRSTIVPAVKTNNSLMTKKRISASQRSTFEGEWDQVTEQWGNGKQAGDTGD